MAGLPGGCNAKEGGWEGVKIDNRQIVVLRQFLCEPRQKYIPITFEVDLWLARL